MNIKNLEGKKVYITLEISDVESVIEQGLPGEPNAKTTITNTNGSQRWYNTGEIYEVTIGEDE